MSAYQERMKAMANEMANFVHEQIAVSVTQIADSLTRLESIVDTPTLMLTAHGEHNALVKDALENLKKALNKAESAEAISRNAIGLPIKEKPKAKKPNVVGIKSAA